MKFTKTLILALAVSGFFAESANAELSNSIVTSDSFNRDEIGTQTDASFGGSPSALSQTTGKWTTSSKSGQLKVKTESGFDGAGPGFANLKFPEIKASNCTVEVTAVKVPPSGIAGVSFGAEGHGLFVIADRSGALTSGKATYLLTDLDSYFVHSSSDYVPADGDKLHVEFSSNQISATVTNGKSTSTLFDNVALPAEQTLKANSSPSLTVMELKGRNDAVFDDLIIKDCQ